MADDNVQAERDRYWNALMAIAHDMDPLVDSGHIRRLWNIAIDALGDNSPDADSFDATVTDYNRHGRIAFKAGEGLDIAHWQELADKRQRVRVIVMLEGNNE